jgi:hypothetical protein
MREAAQTRSYAAALSVLVVAEWLYLDWASRAPKPLPDNFVHAEWITLHDNPDFRDFVDFLRAELDRIGHRGAADGRLTRALPNAVPSRYLTAHEHHREGCIGSQTIRTSVWVTVGAGQGTLLIPRCWSRFCYDRCR